jgi:hypothetical protein
MLSSIVAKGSAGCVLQETIYLPQSRTALIGAAK